MEMDYTAFRENLQKLINSRGLMLKEFAAEMNMAPGTLTRYLRGDRVPELTYIIKISRYFDVSIDWLIGNRVDKLDGLPKEVREIAELYQFASNSDRTVIRAVLEKYRRGASE